MAEPSLTLVPTLPEAQIAEDLKRKMVDAVAHVCAVMDEARSHGLEVQFNVGTGPFGNFAVTHLKVLKIY